jgi:amino acid transporter
VSHREDDSIAIPSVDAAGVQPADEGREHAALLRGGALSLFGNVVIALGCVAPTVSVALTLASIVAVSSYASPIVVLVTALPMLGIAVAYRRMNRWHVNCGTTYAWGALAISPYFGWMVGWVIILAYVLGTTVIALPIGSYAVSIFSNSAPSLVASAAIGTIVIGIVTAIAYVGIRASSRTQAALIMIEYTAVGFLAILGLIGIFGGDSHSEHFHWNWFSWHSLGGISGFVNASLVAVFMYSGWDAAVSLNEETEDSQRSPGQAVVRTVLLTALVLAFLTFALQGGVRYNALQANGANALSYIGRVLGDTALAKLMILAVLLSAVGSVLATIIVTGRAAFAMGYDKVLPPLFGRTHPRHKTPVSAMLIGSVFAVIWLWLYAIGSTTRNAFSALVSTDGLLFALLYIATGLTVAVYFRRLAVRGIRGLLELAILPLASAAWLSYVIWRSIPGLGGWGGRNLLYLYILFGIGAALMLYARWRKESDYFERPSEAFDARPEE